MNLVMDVDKLKGIPRTAAKTIKGAEQPDLVGKRKSCTQKIKGKKIFLLSQGEKDRHGEIMLNKENLSS